MTVDPSLTAPNLGGEHPDPAAWRNEARARYLAGDYPAATAAAAIARAAAADPAPRPQRRGGSPSMPDASAGATDAPDQPLARPARGRATTPRPGGRVIA